ncbi:N-acetylmuramoyl-L-alanine amidase [Synechococcus sp. CS-1328]|uniref:N-acetylmuramoyl-L-alanine amidase n=1 Tax=Synechococcus sp. CS-1328 TaxID=2847976 RepID=UPI00223C3586|nr:N-acetylmuramoyl-L-alanine amidase [Synechococcus sp. CS-1328]MCT0226161.1 N-acetylmuramoyl-L-alanine amidase [Synechococcus sp. CS-1328]
MPLFRMTPKRLSLLLAPLLVALAALPAWAASSLGAWRISREGILELRTTPGVQLQAFFEEGSGGRGPRIWVDLPGAPQRSRTISGGGAIREVRIGRPDSGTTRLVVEFQPGTRLDPRQLRLVGTSRDRWRMDLRGVQTRAAVALGEGNMEAPTIASSGWTGSSGGGGGGGNFSSATTPLSADGLPVVPKGRFKVVLDPGHGGPDPGAVGIGGLRETNVVLDVGLQVAQLLQARGVQVLMTRTSEVDVDLPPRVTLANSNRADVFVSIHANALSMARPDVNGIETFYFQGNDSRQLAASLQRQMLAISPGSPDRGVRTGRFYVIRRTVMPASLVEMGFVTGNIDAPRLADPNFRRRMALALAAGILDYLQRS